MWRKNVTPIITKFTAVLEPYNKSDKSARKRYNEKNEFFMVLLQAKKLGIVTEEHSPRVRLH